MATPLPSQPLASDPIPGEVRILAREEAAARRLAVNLLRTRLKLARLLHELDRHRHFAAVGCASLVEYARTLGIDPAESHLLRRVGDALRREPGLKERILAGHVDLPTAALIGELHATPGAVRRGERLVDRAAGQRAHVFRRETRARLEEVRQDAGPLLALTVHVRPGVRDGFDRARVVASRRAREVQSAGQVFGTLVRHYLDTFDPLCRPRVQRRPRTTKARAGSRSIPPAVAQAIRERSGDRCEVPGCRHSMFLQFGHLRAHRAGGEREIGDLVHLCAAHHRAFDAGQVTFDGWSEAGKPRFLLFDERPPGAVPRTSGWERSRAPPKEPGDASVEAEEPSGAEGA